jgi:hypothetical protein
MHSPQYSPDLAATDFHMFVPMKQALRWRRFSSDEVIGAVQIWRHNQISFLTELKNLWNARTGALKSRESTLKSNITFVSVYLQ